MTQTKPTTPSIAVDGGHEAFFELAMAEGWGDGLPVVPPTEERVAAALACVSESPDEVIGLIPPGQGEASVLKVAINAVMAGCLPEYLPVVVAATRGLCEPSMNVYGIQATTHPVTIAGFTNGPISNRLGINSSWGCLGPGNRANATIGRAIRFVCQNIGLAIPGEMDTATHGQPAKYSFFFAENEADSPWEPHHVTEGFAAEQSTVTLFAAGGFVNMLEPTGDGDQLARAMAKTMPSPTGNDYLFGGEPWLVISPEHASVLVSGTYKDKASLQQYLWETARLAPDAFSDTALTYWASRAWTHRLGDLAKGIPAGSTPDRIRIVVAGGFSIHTVYIPSFGHNASVTIPIAEPGARSGLDG